MQGILSLVFLLDMEMQRTNTSHKIEGIILAAGLSTRMGVPKLTLEIEGDSHNQACGPRCIGV